MGDSADSFPVYCMSNKKDDTASPKCYKSKTIGFKDDSSRVYCIVNKKDEKGLPKCYLSNSGSSPDEPVKVQY